LAFDVPAPSAVYHNAAIFQKVSDDAGSEKLAKQRQKILRLESVRAEAAQWEAFRKYCEDGRNRAKHHWMWSMPRSNQKDSVVPEIGMYVLYGGQVRVVIGHGPEGTLHLGHVTVSEAAFCVPCGHIAMPVTGLASLLQEETSSSD
jgi:hypothetical protein